MNTKLIETITLPPLEGKKLIQDAKDIFTGYVDSDFKNWNTKTYPSKQMKIEVKELTDNATFEQMFSKDDFLTQDQIIYFIENFESLLSKEGYSFFPFKSGNEILVARVYLRSDGYLNAFVFRFSNDLVWRAEYRHRLMVPQLTPKSSAFDTTDVKAKCRAFIDSLEELYKTL